MCLCGACHAAVLQAGLAAPPSFDDFLWASSIFWSRSMALPVTYTTATPDGIADADSAPSPQQQQQQQQQAGAGGSSGSSGSVPGSVLRVQVLEGLVPGLDIANHSREVRCSVLGGHGVQTATRWHRAPHTCCVPAAAQCAPLTPALTRLLTRACVLCVPRHAAQVLVGGGAGSSSGRGTRRRWRRPRAAAWRPRGEAHDQQGACRGDGCRGGTDARAGEPQQQNCARSGAVDAQARSSVTKRVAVCLCVCALHRPAAPAAARS
jgi:hypothetical protein